jgi:PPOX class probable F420-dependent enzyme
VFALVEEAGRARAYWVVDSKPKRSRRLRRLRNLKANPAAEFVVDGYDEDWNRLWWVRATGRGRVVSDSEERAAALAALRKKYPRYHDLSESATTVAIDIERFVGWSAT